MENTVDIVLALTTHPVEGSHDLARTLVERQLAACVHVVPSVHAVYRWQGQVETADEARLEIKTTRRALPELEALIRELHPYEVPELLAVPVTDGLPAYLEWVRTSVV